MSSSVDDLIESMEDMFISDFYCNDVMLEPQDKSDTLTICPVLSLIIDLPFATTRFNHHSLILKAGFSSSRIIKVHAPLIRHKCICLFGRQASFELAFLFSIYGTNLITVGHCKVNLSGSFPNGTYTIEQLVLYGYLTTEASGVQHNENDNYESVLLELGEIAAAFSFIAMFNIKKMEEEGKDVSRYRKIENSRFPIPMQYPAAGGFYLTKIERDTHDAFIESLYKAFTNKSQGYMSHTVYLVHDE